MNDINEIQQALALLEQEDSKSDRPAVVVMPPDSENFLIGNRSGFLKLAIASLKAAQGQKQTFDNLPWFVVEDYDFPLAGLIPDEYAHMHLPTQPTKRQEFLQKVWSITLMVMIVVPFIAGLATLASWLGHLMHLL